MHHKIQKARLLQLLDYLINLFVERSICFCTAKRRAAHADALSRPPTRRIHDSSPLTLRPLCLQM